MEISVLHGTVLQTNNYVVKDKGNAVLIEASCSLDDLKKELGENKLVGILLTHAHWDHYSNLQKIAESFMCPIYVAKEGLEKIQSPERAFSTDRKPQIDVKNFKWKMIKDGDCLDFGGGLKFNVFSTPGHTNCSVCYLLERENQNILFSGDTIFEQGFGRTDLPTGSFNELKQSIEKILKFDDSTLILPGHGSKTMLYHERDFLNELIKEL